MVADGLLVAEGKGRATRYKSATATFQRVFPREGLREDEVWRNVRTAVRALSDPSAANATVLLGVAFTEMLNNAIDHSASREVGVDFEVRGGVGRFTVTDWGVGAYENVRQSRALPSNVAALQEISKGKLTTQPERHTGQGLFFTSKIADRFELEANGLRWVVDNVRGDTAISETATKQGTIVRFELSLATTTTMAEVSAQYEHEDHQFDTSRVVVKLFEYGVEFVSRSEAKRVVSRLGEFRHVIFDFAGVQLVGQGFADEVFRVWAGEHREVHISMVNMVPNVARVVQPKQPLSAGQLVVSDFVKEFDYPLGWNEAAIRKTIDDPDAIVQLTSVEDPAVPIIAVRRNSRTADWTFLAIVVAVRGGNIGVGSAFALPRAEISKDLWTSPTEALSHFVELYGLDLRIGQSVPKKFFLGETHPLSRFDPSAPLFAVAQPQGKTFGAFVRARQSALGAAVVAYGFAIDYTKYREALRRAGIRIDVA